MRVPRSEAEATRRRLRELDVLRTDLEVARDGDAVVFPVVEACGPRLPTAPWDFVPREARPNAYLDLLPADLRPTAPRAFEQVGDIVVVKVPPALQGRATEIGDALLRFHAARAVFHDRGVKGDHRTRDLVRIAGAGESLTQVGENGVRLWVDPAKAYFSPRLATERARLAAMVRPGEHAVDLFGGVAPFGVQLAQKGAVVDSVDLNPEAVELARRNAKENRVAARLHLHLGDARAVAARLGPADRIVMNLPHGAAAFLDVAARLAAPGATVHLHEILPSERVAARGAELAVALAALGRTVQSVTHRTVRAYSPSEVQAVFDLHLSPSGASTRSSARS